MTVAAESLIALARTLADRRQTILQAWRTAVHDDPALTTPSSLPRSQFNDHIPALLDAFEHRLAVWPDKESAASGLRRQDDAASHGRQRWQQGYQLREVTREWGHLQLCLVNELNWYAAAHPTLDPEVMAPAWRALAELCGQGVSESASQYFQIQQVEAAGHLREMEKRLVEFRELDTQRTQLLRQAAHDLRGNVGAVRNATAGIAQEDLPEAMRGSLLRLLQRSVGSLHGMLDEVMDLARLEAGQEVRTVRPFDVSAELGQLVEQLQPLATERGLTLQASGPATLTVDGDGPKVRRIVQNLALNAIQHTPAGTVIVSWGDSRNDDPKRWMVCVRDTGPGFSDGAVAPVAAVLKEATQDALDVQRATAGAEIEAPSEPVLVGALPETGADYRDRSEGIGLSIVKRLCDMLDASVELESGRNEGTLFRIVLPRHYEPVPTAD